MVFSGGDPLYLPPNKLKAVLTQVDAILVTHEHSDHISGLPVLARRLKKPFYMTRLMMKTFWTKPR